MSAAGSIFVDTNVLVYAWDRRDPARQAAARAWLEALFASGRGRLSWQVLHEFQSVAARKLNSAPWEVREFVETLTLWGPLDTSIQLVRDAWEWIDRSQISYWDALIVAAAIRQDAKWLLTEDLQAGMQYDELKVVNPFVSRPGDFGLLPPG